MSGSSFISKPGTKLFAHITENVFLYTLILSTIYCKNLIRNTERYHDLTKIGILTS